ncbi:MAG: 1-acyl-sn-glycerol-3-phosphate acyltransferase [Actinobacteria bacterium]|nr:1-acyl-sn-glycerol-3-phosphate acyltransferase [Actinomycetota bacterium]
MKEYKLKTKRPKIFHCILGTIKFVLRVFFKIFFRLEVMGTDKIPLRGRLILCSNHISYADPVIISAYFPRVIFFMAKIEVFTGWLLKSFFKYFNTFPVNRKKFDRQTIRYSLQILSDDEVVGIFPEGSRSTDGVLRDAQKGVGLISVMGKSSILPVAISGTNMIVQKPHKRFFFPKLRLIFGDVINTSEIINKYSHNDATEMIMKIAMERIKLLYEQIK